MTGLASTKIKRQNLQWWFIFQDTTNSSTMYQVIDNWWYNCFYFQGNCGGYGLMGNGADFGEFHLHPFHLFSISNPFKSFKLILALFATRIVAKNIILSIELPFWCTWRKISGQKMIWKQELSKILKYWLTLTHTA